MFLNPILVPLLFLYNGIASDFLTVATCNRAPLNVMILACASQAAAICLATASDDV